MNYKDKYTTTIKKYKNTIKNNYTHHNNNTRKTTNKHISHIINFFLSMLQTIKLFHWNTKNFAQHKATDELYDKMNNHIDKFVEVLLGKQNRFLTNKCKNKAPITNAKDFVKCLNNYVVFLEGLENHISSSESDLLNIRDEMLADINTTIYLFRLA